MCHSSALRLTLTNRIRPLRGVGTVHKETLLTSKTYTLRDMPNRKVRPGKIATVSTPTPRWVSRHPIWSSLPTKAWVWANPFPSIPILNCKMRSRWDTMLLQLVPNKFRYLSLTPSSRIRLFLNNINTTNSSSITTFRTILLWTALMRPGPKPHRSRLSSNSRQPSLWWEKSSLSRHPNKTTN